MDNIVIQKKINFVVRTIMGCLQVDEIKVEPDFEETLRTLLTETFEDCVSRTPQQMIDEALKGEDE